MIRKNRHIVIVFLIANLLVSNIGLSANWMYCFCKGQMQVSLFSLDEKCKKDSLNTDNCCSKDKENEANLKPCCKKFQKYSHTEKPCTQKGKKYFKADLKFFLSEKDDSSLKKYTNNALLTIGVVAHVYPFYYKYHLYPSFTKALPTPLPCSYGRSLLCFVQNFRC